MDREEMIKELARTMPPYASYSSGKFVPGKTPVLYSGPYWDNEEIEIALKAFLTGPWIVAGEYVTRFQNMFAKKFNVERAHMVNSGSSANLVLISALKKRLHWQDGDEVIVSPVGFPTTVAPLLQNNLKPVFADIELNTLNFDVSQVGDKITKRTQAIFVSPVLGNPPDMSNLSEFDTPLVGDNCDSLGSRWAGHLLSDYYEAWSTSFYPAHHITTGEGGMVCSNDAEVVELARSFSWWGRDCYCVGKANLLPCGTCGRRFDRWLPEVDAVIDHKYVFQNVGYNLKPLDMQGAIGIAQLKKFDKIDQLRKENFHKIAKVLSKLSSVHVADTLLQADPCWFGVPVVCDTQEVKESLVNHLENNKVQTRSYFAGNLLHHEGYKNLDDAKKYPNANKALTHVFFLGCPPHYTDSVVSYIDSVLEDWKKTE